MALPLLAPLAWLLPILKILAVGSIKFVGVGIGAAIAPVATANLLVSMSSGTPLKYAQFRCSNGHFSKEQLDLIEQANDIISASLTNDDERMDRSEARAFLKEVLVSTFVGMKGSVLSIPSTIGQLFSRLKRFFNKS